MKDYASHLASLVKRCGGGIGILCVIIGTTPMHSPAQDAPIKERVLYTFSGGSDGSQPDASVVRNSDGTLYGTTYGGGNSSASCYFGPIGCGVVFTLDAEGHEHVIYPFTGGADGANPEAPLIFDPAGNIYGTTAHGGNTSSSCPFGLEGCGVVFELTATGERVLHTFSGAADGSVPGGLVRDEKGNLYGTTAAGGNTSSSCPFGPQGCGVVFKLDRSGHEGLLYTFTGGEDGAMPQGTLISDAAGNLYGTTTSGGNSNSSCPSGCGVVFELNPDDPKEEVLYRFTGGTDGANPIAGVILDGAGNLYGTTASGGDAASSCLGGPGCGVVFKLDRNRKQSVLYTFTGGPDGGFPLAPLIRDAAGNLYGTAELGGNMSDSCSLVSDGCGVVFRIDSSDKEDVLYTFTGGPDGAFPGAGLIRDSNGNFYSTAYGGGDFNSPCAEPSQGCGVVFELYP